MINENGQFELLTIDDALEIARNLMIQAGYTITPGSVEEQMQFAFAENILEYDKNQYASYQKYLTPSGSDLDLQNPNVPRLGEIGSSGYLQLINDTGSDINVSVNSIFTAANGNKYSTQTNMVTVTPGSSAFITVFSEGTGTNQNLVRNTTFSSDYELTVINPQPFDNGRDAETNAQYKTRLIERRTNLASYHATNTAIEELKQYYNDARFYVNNDPIDDTVPVAIPANGYTAVVLTPSGVTASAEELSNAFQVIANRLQFGNSLKTSTTLHPVLSGIVYSGNTPATYYLVPAQVVEFTLGAGLNISFDARTSEQEKVDLALAFAQFFAQNLLDYFGGAAGNVNVVFTPIDPYEAPVNTTVSVEANDGIINKIAPSFSLEQVRALISDASNFESVNRLKYESVSDLAIELDPLQAYESNIILDINDDYEPDSVNFATNALFSDDTSWFDRFIFLDPSLLTINLFEVDFN